jgi:hypothetical protein
MKFDIKHNAWISLPLLVWLLLALPTYAASPGDFETEAQRLKAVRTLIQQDKSRRLHPSSKVNPAGADAQCERMLKDLLSGKEFKAIEPVAVLNFEYPIQNAEFSIYDRVENLLPPLEKQQSENAAKQLGPLLNEGIQRCTDEEANGDERKGSVLFNGFNFWAGGPPYRAYTLPKKVNPFPKSKLIYWSEYVEASRKGRNGYSWVNLDICEYVDSTFGISDSLQRKNDPNGQAAALTIYRGKLVAWEVSRNYAFVADQLAPKYKSPQKSRNICRWSTYPEELVRK